MNIRSEIQIFLDKPSKAADNYAKGNALERMIRNVLESNQYEITSNPNFTIGELDLWCEHKHDKDILFVECKAKEKVSVTDLQTFGYKIYTKKPAKAYFIHTVELDHYASGTKLEEFDNNNELRNVTFYGPNKIIELLQSHNKIEIIREHEIPKQVTKRFLIFTQFGDFFAYIVNSTSFAVPTDFYLFSAKDGMNITDSKTAKAIQNKIPEITALKFKTLQGKTNLSTTSQIITETVVEISQSDSWLDYKPASEKFFVGRTKIRGEIMQFFRSVLNGKINKRVFYLSGKSGIGKSSLINAIKATSFNKQNKPKFFVFTVDSINAETEQFVGLAFQELFKKAIANSFIKEDGTVSDKISFVSSFDLLSDSSVQQIMRYLKANNKILILIFDQFEDVFRRDYLYKPFHEFLLHINNEQGNIIVGFSWKNEITLSPESGSHKFWQQAKGLGVPFELNTFNNEEVNLLIGQLENEPKIGKLSNSLKSLLVENSQGYPWLIKKLCIHIYNEVVIRKQKISDLAKSNLNINNLFKKDIDELSGIESNALMTIAKNADTGSFFHETEIPEIISEKVIKSLLDRRLIIKTGQFYKPYWDVFREYLLRGNIIPLTANHILRQSPNVCLEKFLLFEVGKKYSLAALNKKIDKESKSRSSHLVNILIDLQKMDLIQKDDEGNYFLSANITPDESSFILIAKERIKESKVYSELLNSNETILSTKKIAEIYKNCFDFTSTNEQTWYSYATTLIGWIFYLELDIKHKILKAEKGRRGGMNLDNSKDTAIIYNSPDNIIKIVKDILGKGIMQNIKDYPSAILRDLGIMGFLEKRGSKLILVEEKRKLLQSLILQDEIEFKKEIAKTALKLNKIKTVTEIYRANPFIKAKELYNDYTDLFGKSVNESSGPTYASKLKPWAEFILNSENNFIEITAIKPDKEQRKIKTTLEKSLKKSVSGWEKNYQKLLRYYNKYGHSNINSKYGPLGTWVFAQRKFKDTLTEEQIQKLDDVEYNWVPADKKKRNYDAAWETQYDNLKKYYDKNGHSNLQARDGTLGTWIVAQRKKALTEQQKEKLNAIEFPWDPRMKEWEVNFKKWLDYVAKYPNRPILAQDKQFPQLGRWVDKQRKKKRANKLENKRYLKLKDTPFPFNPKKLWIESYNELKVFRELNGHIQLPPGKDYEQLRGWLAQQRNRIKNGTLSPEKVKLLFEIGVV
jgi:Helicase associated domain